MKTRTRLFSLGPQGPALAFAICFAGSASAQKLLHTHIGDANQLRLGKELRAAGDVDGDGFGDYLICLASASPNGQASGEVRVISGPSGAVIRTHAGQTGGDTLGTAAVGVGDLNSDGMDEIAVGAPTTAGGGTVTVFSGVDGSAMYTLPAATSGSLFGADLASLGDVNGDGVPDFGVASPADNSGPTNLRLGTVFVYSGSTGTLLYAKYGDNHLDDFGTRVRGVGDVNGDGRGDFLVGAPRDDDNGPSSGAAHMVSGLDGATLWRTYGAVGNDRFGWTLDGAGADMNGDGVPDVIVGTLQSEYAWVLSGVDGSLIRAHAPASAICCGLGRGVCALDDVNADGFGDYAIGDHRHLLFGEVRVHSGATGDEIYVLPWVEQNDGFGQTVSNVGDLTGDGVDEFGIGATGFDSPTLGNTGRAGIYSPQPPTGVRYCTPGVIGSAGRSAEITAYGSNVIGDDCLSLTVAGVPPGSFGFFFGGTAQNLVMPGGSIGIVCLGGPNPARFSAPGQVIRGPGGSIEVDILQIPGNPTRPVVSGETWHFQCWFRDSTPAGVATNNFSDAVRIAF